MASLSSTSASLWVHPPPMIHPIIVGISMWTGHFQPTMWEREDLPWGDRCRPASLHPFMTFTIKSRQYSIRPLLDPWIFVLPVSRLHINLKLNQLKNETTSWFMLMATSKSCLFSFSFSFLSLPFFFPHQVSLRFKISMFPCIVYMAKCVGGGV